MTPKAFPAAPYAAVTFPDDEYIAVPARLVEGLVPPAGVTLWLLLTRLAEGHQEVEVSTRQLEQHTGLTAAEIGDAIRALASDGWLTVSEGRFSGSYVYRLLRMPPAAEIREWAEDLQEPHRPPSTPAPVFGQQYASPGHQAAFQRGRADSWQ